MTILPTPRSMSETLNPSAMSDTSLAAEYVALIAAFQRLSPPGSGIPPSEALLEAQRAIMVVQAEMARRVEAAMARSSVATQAAASARAVEAAFSRHARASSEYRPIFHPSAGTDMIGWYWVREYCDGLFSVRCVPALAKVFDREGHQLWLTEAGITAPMVDPIAVIVGAGVGYVLGAPSLLQAVRGVAPGPVGAGAGAMYGDLARRAAVGGAVAYARNSTIQGAGEVILGEVAIAIPRPVLRTLVDRSRRQ